MTIHTYSQPLGYKLQIKSRDGTEPYYTFDSFDQKDGITQPINVQDMHINLNSAMSRIDFKIEDSARTVDRTKVSPGQLVIFQYGKHKDFWSNPKSYVFVGFIDFPSPERPSTNVNDIQVEVQEIKKGFYETLMNFQRSSPLAELLDPNSQKAQDYTVRAHLRRLIQKKGHTILDDLSLKDRFAYDESGISKNLDSIIPNVSYNYEHAGDIIDDLINKTGAVWGMDYSNGGRKVFADYAVNMRAPIIIKQGPVPYPESLIGDKTRTSYITEGFNLPSSSSMGSGHGTRLFGLTRVDKHIVASYDAVSHSTTLTNKAIYQPFTTNEVRFNGLDFTCSKVGEPSSPKNRINGAISTNKIVNGVNMPDIRLMEWHVPLDDIESGRTVVHVELDDIRTRFIDQNITFGITWFQRSGIEEGDPNNDEDNTIRIYRDNATNGESSIAQGGDRKANLTWKAHGPRYAHSVTSSLNRVFAVTNYTQALKTGFIEPDPIDLDVIDDANLALRHLGNILLVTSSYKTEPRLKVTCPDDFCFLPYQTCRLVDSLSIPTGYDYEIHEIDINFEENTNEVSLAGVVYLDDAWPNNWPCIQVI